MTIRHLDQLLQPASVAVIGASDRPASVGATVWRNLRAGRFGGPVMAVNPRLKELDGEPVARDVAALPATPDLAVICTPPASVPGLIRALGARGTRAAIVMTAGLDRATRQAMLDAARPHLLRILGPNCLGLLSPHVGLNASFSHAHALPGEIAFVSQSGALVTAVLDWARSRRIGFSHLISLGEHADVDFGDLLDHLGSDPRTRAILLYIESIDAPRKFMSAARAAARNKPVIVVKAGRGARGAAAAASHTGALAGSDIVFDAAIRRAGMLRVDTLQDLFMAAEALARFRGDAARPDAGLTIMTNGGGAGVMAADAAELAGIPLRDMTPELQAKLDAVLPATWSHANPIDIIGDAPGERYTATLRALFDDPDTGAVLFAHAPTAIVRSDDIARACAPLLRQHAGRMLACWLGDGAVASARQIFEEAGVADFETPEEAVRAFGMLRTYRANQALLRQVPAAGGQGQPDTQAARAVLAGARAAGRNLLDEVEAKAVLAAYGIPTVPTRAVAADPDAAVAAAEALGYPAALKILSPDISHKSDAGGVALGLADAAAVREAAQSMLSRLARALPQARLTGFSVQPMARRPMAVELIVGASVDRLFGPVILFGQGGTAVEVVADRSIGLPPLDRVLASDLIERTRVARLLAGYRDHPPARREAIADVLIAVSRMLAELPELAELDINPLWADEQGVLALDARIRLTRPGEAGAGAARFAIAPYPAERVRELDWHGQLLRLRPIRPEDEPQHRAFIAALSPEDMRLRFFQARRELPASELARLTQIDYEREMAFIAERALPRGGHETLGVARAVSDPDNQEAEFALVVRSDLKRQGLGRLLLQTLIDYQRSRGTLRLAGYVLHENLAMRQLCEGLGLEVDPAGGSADALRLQLWLNRPVAG